MQNKSTESICCICCLISHLFIHSYFFVPIVQCVNKPNVTVQSQNITILSDIFRYQLPISKDTIFDAEDGNMHNLKTTFKNVDGTDIPMDSWIQYDPRKYVTDFYIPRALLDEYHKKYRSYRLKGTDSDGNSAEVQYNFYFATKRTVPTYIVRVTLSSSLTAVYSGHDVLILFFIQNNKLFPYANTYNQGNSNFLLYKAINLYLLIKI